MKLRNKKTGKIHNFIIDGDEIRTSNLTSIYRYNSLAELNKEWEDYEYWFVDSGGEIKKTTYLTENDKANLISFGNHFKTKKEAKKAVEKLKAWKRLKDKGFRFEGWVNSAFHSSPFVRFSICDAEKTDKDLDLLFGGEDE